MYRNFLRCLYTNAGICSNKIVKMKPQAHLKKLLLGLQNTGNKFISLELYANMEVDVKDLNDLCPNFCAIAWGHGDTTNPKSLKEFALNEKLSNNGYNVLLHLGARNLNRESVTNILNTAKENGIRNILALKGGAPKIEEDDSKVDFPYAIDLVKFIKEHFGDHFNVAVSGYPIGHPESKDPIKDISYLKEKIEAGGDLVLCQATFDLEPFRKFYRKSKELEVDVPILPGVYLLSSYQSYKGFIKPFVRNEVPEVYDKFFEEHQNDEEALKRFSVKHTAELIVALLTDKEIQIPGVHIFCFNNLDLVEEMYKLLDFAELKVTRPLKFRRGN